jgi:hypothetical protein
MARIFLALLLWVLDTRECNIDMVLLNGMMEGRIVGSLQDVKKSVDLNLRRFMVVCINLLDQSATTTNRYLKEKK